MASTYPSVVVDCAPLCSGRWYWEVKNRDVRSTYFHGVVGANGFAPKNEVNAGVGDCAASWGFNGSGNGAIVARHAGKDAPFGERAYDGSTLCFALDVDAGVLFICKDGAWHTPAFGLAFEGCDFKACGGVQPAVAACSNGHYSFSFGDELAPHACDPPPGFRSLWEACEPAHFVGNAKPEAAAIAAIADNRTIALPENYAQVSPGCYPASVVRGPHSGVVITDGGRAFMFANPAEKALVGGAAAAAEGDDVLPPCLAVELRLHAAPAADESPLAELLAENEGDKEPAEPKFPTRAELLAAAGVQSEHWSCPACTLLNEAGAAVCAVCETARPQAAEPEKPAEKDKAPAATFMPVIAPDGVVRVPGDAFVSAAVGAEHVLLLTADGRVLSCGANEGGQCGADVAVSAVPFSELHTVAFPSNAAPIVAIAACDSFSGAVDAAGRAWAWGTLDGVPRASGPAHVPVDVSALLAQSSPGSKCPRFGRIAASPSSLIFFPVSDVLEIASGSAAMAAFEAPTTADASAVSESQLLLALKTATHGLQLWHRSGTGVPCKPAPGGSTEAYPAVFSDGGERLWQCVTQPGEMNNSKLQLASSLLSVSAPTPEDAFSALQGIEASAAAASKTAPAGSPLGVLASPLLVLLRRVATPQLGGGSELAYDTLSSLLMLMAVLELSAAAEARETSENKVSALLRPWPTRDDAVLSTLCSVARTARPPLPRLFALVALACHGVALAGTSDDGRASVSTALASALCDSDFLEAFPAASAALAQGLLRLSEYNRSAPFFKALKLICEGGSSGDAATARRPGVDGVRKAADAAAAAIFLQRAAPAVSSRLFSRSLAARGDAETFLGLLGGDPSLAAPGASGGAWRVALSTLLVSAWDAAARNPYLSKEGASRTRDALVLLLSASVPDDSGAVEKGKASGVVAAAVLESLLAVLERPEERSVALGPAMADLLLQASMSVSAAAAKAGDEEVPGAFQTPLRLLQRLLSVVEARPELAALPLQASPVLATSVVESAHPFAFGVTQTALIPLSTNRRPDVVGISFNARTGLVCAEDSLTVQPASLTGEAMPWPAGYASNDVKLDVVGPLAGDAAIPSLLLCRPPAPALLVTLKTAPASANAPPANRWGVSLTITEFGGAGTSALSTLRDTLVKSISQVNARIALLSIDVNRALRDALVLDGALLSSSDVSPADGGHGTCALGIPALPAKLLRGGLLASAPADAALVVQRDLCLALISAEQRGSPLSAALRGWLDSSIHKALRGLPEGAVAPDVASVRAALVALSWHAAGAQSLLALGEALATAPAAESAGAHVGLGPADGLAAAFAELAGVVTRYLSVSWLPPRAGGAGAEGAAPAPAAASADAPAPVAASPPVTPSLPELSATFAAEPDNGSLSDGGRRVALEDGKWSLSSETFVVDPKVGGVLKWAFTVAIPEGGKRELNPLMGLGFATMPHDRKRRDTKSAWMWLGQASRAGSWLGQASRAGSCGRACCFGCEIRARTFAGRGVQLRLQVGPPAPVHGRRHGPLPPRLCDGRVRGPQGRRRRVGQDEQELRGLPRPQHSSRRLCARIEARGVL